MDSTLPTAPASSGPTHGEAAKKTSEPTKTEVKPSPLSFARDEFKTITVQSPEKMTEPVTFSQESYETLVFTLTYHFDKINRMKNSATPKALTTEESNFYNSFKRLNPGVDLNNPKNVAECAKKFLEMGGAEVMAIVKLAEYEAISLQAATGREIVPVDKGTTKGPKEIGKEVNIIFTEDGAEIIEESAGSFLQRMLHGKREIKSTQFKIKGGTNIDILATTQRFRNSLLTAEQIEFLTECGFKTGVLSAEQVRFIDMRLAKIAALRRELFLKTGLTDHTQIQNELNFIKNDITGRKYRNTKIAHFVGDIAAGANIRDIVQAEAVAISTEVKTKVENEIAKRKEKANAPRTESVTIAQLDREIEKIKKSADLIGVEKDEKIRVINSEIAKLEEEFKLFGRQKALPGEITKAEEDLKGNKVKLEERAKQLGYSIDDLIHWSADVSDPESWKKLQNQLTLLQSQKAAIQSRIDKLQTSLDKHESTRPQVELKTATRTDAATQDSITVNPHEQDIALVEDWRQRKKELQSEIGKLEKRIYENTWKEEAQTLEDQITDLTDKITSRKQIVEDDPTTRQVIEEYRKAEKIVKGKTDEKTATDNKVIALTDAARDEAKLRAEIKAKQDELKEIQAGGLTGKDKAEVQALNALKSAYEQSTKAKRAEILAEAEFYDLEYVIYWKQYPDAINRCVQLIWGDDVLSANPEHPEIAEQVKALMKSKKYLDIFITAIESAEIITAQKSDLNASTADGSYEDIGSVFNNAEIRDISKNKINEDIIKAIIEEMRKRALNVTSASP